MFLLWYDDTPRKTPDAKIDGAVAAYIDRFRTRPNVVLVNEADQVAIRGVTVRTVDYVRRDNFWVGRE